MSDYIRREAVKEAAWERFINRLVEDQGMYGYLVSLVNEVFDSIPAADVRPVVRGKWKLVGSVFPVYECDQCHAISLGGNFCPNCGAFMKEDRE